MLQIDNLLQPRTEQVLSAGLALLPWLHGFPPQIAAGPGNHDLRMGRPETGFEMCQRTVRKTSSTETGETLAIAFSLRDIREQKRREQELRDGEARLRGILDSAVDGIVTINERGIIERANPAAPPAGSPRRACAAGATIRRTRGRRPL